LASHGQRILSEGQALLTRHGLEDVFSFSGHPTWSFLNIKEARGATAFEIKTLWMQEILERGILSVGTHNVNYAHTDADIDRLLAVYEEVLPYIGSVLNQGSLRQVLRCEPLVPLFKLR
jgi:glutamate-1-semialdehyde 2,1-aminomutase